MKYRLRFMVLCLLVTLMTCIFLFLQTSTVEQLEAQNMARSQQTSVKYITNCINNSVALLNNKIGLNQNFEFNQRAGGIKFQQDEDILELFQMLKNDSRTKLPRNHKLNQPMMRDSEVDTLLNKLPDITIALRSKTFEDIVAETYLEYQDRRTEKGNGTLKLRKIPTYEQSKALSHWQQFLMSITDKIMYSPGELVDDLLNDMRTQPIIDLGSFDKGTQLKLIAMFRNGGKAVLKPMRVGRDWVTPPDYFLWEDYERHNAEIAAYHVDRVLGINRVLPTAGRFLNVTSEIYKYCPNKMKKTFFKSPENNYCFHGQCKKFCESPHNFCGKGQIIEGSLMVMLPKEIILLKRKNGFKQSYSRKYQTPEWQKLDKCTDLVISPSVYLLDLVDMHIFDFLIGNMDRHHTYSFEDFGHGGYLIYLDNGRGFGKPHRDEESILGPLMMCCKIRKSTFLKLAKLYVGPERFSHMVDQSTKKDILYPIITEDHLVALERRIVIVLRTVAKCVERTREIKNVVIEHREEKSYVLPGNKQYALSYDFK